jgi:phosphoribosylglycinamide formyltransferase 1
MKKIAIFASGSGTNAQAIIEYFKGNKKIIIDSIFTNNKNAFVIDRAKKFSIQTYVFTRDDFYNSSKIVDLLKERKVDFIVLAGFLWLIPESLIKSYPERIVNIHPALLPKYGGKGMYGMLVHQSIIDNKEKESGITIHYVNERYDEGNIIFQAKCTVDPSDTADSLAQKIHKLEYLHYPKVIDEVISGLVKN